MLCSTKRINCLKEITRSVSNNQLDYIFIDEQFKNNNFVTSYNNFISDHKTIVLRVGLNDNQLTQEAKERLTFDRESHLKQSSYQDQQASADKDYNRGKYYTRSKRRSGEGREAEYMLNL